MKHLAIFTKGVGEKILSGEKTVESRFSRVKNPPFGAVATGDMEVSRCTVSLGKPEDMDWQVLPRPGQIGVTVGNDQLRAVVNPSR